MNSCQIDHDNYTGSTTVITTHLRASWPFYENSTNSTKISTFRNEHTFASKPFLANFANAEDLIRDGNQVSGLRTSGNVSWSCSFRLGIVVAWLIRNRKQSNDILARFHQHDTSGLFHRDLLKFLKITSQFEPMDNQTKRLLSRQTSQAPYAASRTGLASSHDTTIPQRSPTNWDRSGNSSPSDVESPFSSQRILEAGFAESAAFGAGKPDSVIATFRDASS